MIGNYIENSINYMNEMENVKIGCYVIMPDHVHMIVEFGDVVGSTKAGRGGTLPLQRIIGRLKSYTTKRFNVLNGTVGVKLWQRGFYERIIRNENEYVRTCEYIENNPINYCRKYNFHKIQKNT